MKRIIKLKFIILIPAILAAILISNGCTADIYGQRTLDAETGFAVHNFKRKAFVIPGLSHVLKKRPCEIRVVIEESNLSAAQTAYISEMVKQQAISLLPKVHFTNATLADQQNINSVFSYLEKNGNLQGYARMSPATPPTPSLFLEISVSVVAPELTTVDLVLPQGEIKRTGHSQKRGRHSPTSRRLETGEIKREFSYTKRRDVFMSNQQKYREILIQIKEFRVLDLNHKIILKKSARPLDISSYAAPSPKNDREADIYYNSNQAYGLDKIAGFADMVLYGGDGHNGQVAFLFRKTEDPLLQILLENYAWSDAFEYLLEKQNKTITDTENLGILYEHYCYFRRARQCYEKVLRDSPDSAIALRGIWRLYFYDKIIFSEVKK